ncbi:hypothetical protein FB451DRAFT_1175251 [Mycena latifolia]|nr:hypothetical protein FB451DRAFT_1175251 [Mycena latifolia]
MEFCNLVRAQHHKAHSCALGHELHRLLRADGVGCWGGVRAHATSHSVIVAGLLCSNREGVSVESGGNAGHYGATCGPTRRAARTGRRRADHRLRVGVGRDSRCTRVRLKARERAVDASRPTDEKSDSTTPHAALAGAPRGSAGRCACVARGAGVGVPAKPLRLVATKTRAPSARASQDHDSAGYAARASCAEARDSHSGGSGGASCARPPSSPAHLDLISNNTDKSSGSTDLRAQSSFQSQFYANHPSISGDLGLDFKRCQVKCVALVCMSESSGMRRICTRSASRQEVVKNQICEEFESGSASVS